MTDQLTILNKNVEQLRQEINKIWNELEYIHYCIDMTDSKQENNTDFFRGIIKNLIL